MTGDPTTDSGVPPSRILVLDDEEPIRRILHLMLKRLGHESVCLADGNEALKAYADARQAGKPFAAVIIDLNLASGQSGLVILEQLLALDPEVRAIIASGYIRDSAQSSALPPGVRSTLPKPFRAEDIARAVREALQPP